MFLRRLDRDVYDRTLSWPCKAPHPETLTTYYIINSPPRYACKGYLSRSLTLQVVSTMTPALLRRALLVFHAICVALQESALHTSNFSGMHASTTLPHNYSCMQQLKPFIHLTPLLRCGYRCMKGRQHTLIISGP